jgi:L-malate glycosyltransferase
MKIGFVADGFSNHTKRIADYFASNNHEVHLISRRFRPGYNPLVNKHQLKLVSVLGKKNIYLSALFWPSQVKKIISSIKPDIVNGHYVVVYGFLAALSGFKPLIITAWGSDLLLQARDNLVWGLIARYTLRKADILICLFDSEMIDKKSELFSPHLKILSLPYGIDTGDFRKIVNNNLKKNLGFNSSEPIIIYTRGIAPLYDSETLLRAIPLVNKDFPTAKFAITHKKELPNPYIDLISELEIKNNLVILDWMPREKLVEYLNIADVYVSTSLSDGASNALFEAMACELPPVVTDIPANRYWIKHGENGLLFKPGDYTGLANLITDLLRDKEKRQAFGKKSRDIVEKKANFKIQMAKIEEAYSGLIKKT